MRHDDEDMILRDALARTAPAVPPGLAARIVAQATAQPQKLGWLTWVRRAFSEWDYALNMKGAALAAFAALGLLSAQLSTPDTSGYGMELTTVLSEPNWTEAL